MKEPMNAKIDLTIVQIAEITAEEFDIPLMKMRGSRGSQKAALARAVAMFLASRHTPKGYVEISRVFNREHSTVGHAVKRVERQLQTDAYLRQRFERLNSRALAMREERVV